MTNPTQPVQRRYVKQMTDGDSVEEVYLVVDKQLRANRNGNLFLQLDLRDRTGAISARLWNATETMFRAFEAGDFVQVKGKVQLFQNALQMILSHVNRVPNEQVELADFLPHTEQEVSKLYERLRVLLRSVANPHLKALAECFLMDNAFVEGFCRAPAGVRMHHAYLGGLLEHVVTMMEMADRIAPLYQPDLDRDLLLLGVFLHDVGKVRELTYERTFGYSDEGQLVGHLVMGVEMLSEKTRQVPELTGETFPQEIFLRLKHMIVSHNGTLEFGSPLVPMTPEATALHFIDSLDSKLHAVTREIRGDGNLSSAWTPFNSSLQRRLYKGGAGGTAETEIEE
jgi:3'-5' exoribonuclease